VALGAALALATEMDAALALALAVAAVAALVVPGLLHRTLPVGALSC
jgi:hypothetical protein